MERRNPKRNPGRVSVVSCGMCRAPVVLDPDVMYRADGYWAIDCEACGASRPVRESDRFLPITAEIAAARLARQATAASERRGLLGLRARRAARAGGAAAGRRSAS